MAVITKRQRRDFSGMEIGESKKFYDSEQDSVYKSTKLFCRKNNLTWKFTCTTEFDCVKVTRIS